ncbi:MAG: ferrous iron transport protein A [Deltaproteobacteria bacterium]|nr:ferrous iron transport protein A [Deltaproteobacteria bacterium]
MHYQADSMPQSFSSRLIQGLDLKRRGHINCRSRLGCHAPCCEEIQETTDRPADIHSNETAGFPLRLAGEGDHVRITGLAGGRGFHDSLAGVGLRPGVDMDVIQNSACGRMLICVNGSRFYLGGGMAQRIQIKIIKGGKQ